MSGAEERYLRAPEVMRRTCLSRSSLYRCMKDGSFPKPCKISRRVVAWKLSEVLAWIHRDATPSSIAKLAQEYQAEVRRAEGRALTTTEAVKAVLRGDTEPKAAKPELLSVTWATYQVLAERVRDRLARIEHLTPVDVADVTWGDVGTLTEVELQLRNIVVFLEGNANGR